MWQPESVLVLVDRVCRSYRVRQESRGGRVNVVEALERRALLSAEITVLAPSDVNVGDGGAVDLNPLIGPVAQIPGRVVQTPFAIRNDGDTPLSLGPVVVTGDFTVAQTPGANLAPGATANLVLALNTATSGTRTSTISIPNNDSNENPFDFQVTVDVTPSGPDISVVNQAGTNMVSGATAVNFGSVSQGQPGPTQTFTVTNRGSAGLSFGSISVPAGFTLTKPLGQGLGFGDQDTFIVQLDSAAVGTHSGVISIPSNDPDENPFVIPVTGTVVAATPAAITVSSNGTNLVSGSTTVKFGNATLGQPGPTRTFTVMNTGGGNLTLGTLTVPAGFTLTEGLTTLLSPGASDTFTVQLDSAVLGTRTGSILIPSSATTGANPFVIPVTGTVTTSGPVVTGPSIAVSSGGSQLVNGTTTVDFGNAQQGQASPVRMFTVSNQGDQTLTITGVTVPQGFTVTEPLAATLSPGGTDTFTVQLDSSVVGTKTGTISIANNDTTQNPFVIPVTGTVTSPVTTGPSIAVSSRGAQLVSGVTPVDFGTALQGAAGPTRTLTVSNRGNATLTIAGVSVPTGYTVIDALATSLPAGASDTLVLQMNTGSVGPRAGTVSISSNDPNVNPFRVLVTGTVLSTTPMVSVQVGSQTIVDGSTTVNFGTVGQGQTGPMRTFRVTNRGGAPLTLGAVNVPTGFTLVDPLSGTLAPGATDTFVVQLNSSGLGAKTGTITFNTNDPNHGTFSVPVRGTVVTAVPAVTVRQGGVTLESGATPVDFGTVRQGSAGTLRTFTVTNTGTGTLRLHSLRAPSGFRVTEGLVSTLAPGASDSFTVQMTSTMVGTKRGTVRFSTNDPNQNQFAIPVTGEVMAVPTPTPTPTPTPFPGPTPSPGPVPVPGGGSPEVVVQRGTRNVVDGETTVRFGRAVRGRQGPMRTFTVTNTGSAELRLRRVRLPAGFALVDGLTTRLAPGASDTFTVRMRTAAPGAKGGVIRIATNDATENPFEIRVSGRVRAPAAGAPHGGTVAAHLFSERLIEEVT